MSHCLQTIHISCYTNTTLPQASIHSWLHNLVMPYPLYHYASWYQTNVMKTPLSNEMKLPSIAVLRHKAFLWWRSHYPQMTTKSSKSQESYKIAQYTQKFVYVSILLNKQFSPQRANTPEGWSMMLQRVTKLFSRHRNLSLSPSSWTSTLPKAT